MSRLLRSVAALCLLGAALVTVGCDSDVQVDGAGGASSSSTGSADVATTGSAQPTTGSASSGGGGTTCVLDASNVDECTLE